MEGFTSSEFFTLYDTHVLGMSSPWLCDFGVLESEGLSD